jgi:hypothetical protein
MERVKIGIVVLFAAALTGCGGFTQGKPAAERAVAHFHDLFNQGKLEGIWNQADPSFRNASTRKKYDDFMGAVQRKLGKVTSSSNAGWKVQSFNMKTRVLMNQNTVFDQGRGTESFTFALDGTNAVLMGYNIQSMDLITK